MQGACGSVSCLRLQQHIICTVPWTGRWISRMIFRGYILRYVILIFILLVLMKTEVMNPLIFFFSYVICMKVTAFLQPLTHKLCNKLFHETDPIPQAMPEETAGGENAPENPEGAEKNGEVTEQQNK